MKTLCRMKNILKESLDDTRELKLSHEENIFTIRFAALDYTEPAGIQYAYILEGFEKSGTMSANSVPPPIPTCPKGIMCLRYVPPMPMEYGRITCACLILKCFLPLGNSFCLFPVCPVCSVDYNNGCLYLVYDLSSEARSCCGTAYDRYEITFLYRYFP